MGATCWKSVENGGRRKQKSFQGAGRQRAGRQAGRETGEGVHPTPPPPLTWIQECQQQPGSPGCWSSVRESFELFTAFSRGGTEKDLFHRSAWCVVCVRVCVRACACLLWFTCLFVRVRVCVSFPYCSKTISGKTTFPRLVFRRDGCCGVCLENSKV